MSRESKDAIRAEHAMSSRARRSRKEQEAYFRRTPPDQQRRDNVARAMANGSFATTRFQFNRDNAGKAEMDSAGNIVPAASKPAPAPTAQRPRQPRDVMPPRQPPQPGPAPTMGKTAMKPGGAGLIDGEPAAQFFQRTADRQQQPNKFATPRAAPTSTQPKTDAGFGAAIRKNDGPATAPQPSYSGVADPASLPRSGSVGEMIADIDKAQATLRDNSSKLKAAFAPRQAPQTASAPDTIKGPQQTNPGASAVAAAANPFPSRAAKVATNPAASNGVGAAISEVGSKVGGEIGKVGSLAMGKIKSFFTPQGDDEQRKKAATK